MTKVRAILFFSAIVILAMGVNTMAGGAGGTDSGAFFQQAATPEQSAVFAAFVAANAEEGLDTAISVSNVLAAPSSNVLNAAFGGANRRGTLEFYLFLQDGSLVFYETEPGSPGVGLNADGTLAPGQTYTVLLSELASAAGVADEQVIGYLWVVANFDAVQGSYSLTFFEIGFTQAFLMAPQMGGVFFAGIPMRLIASGVVGIP